MACFKFLRFNKLPCFIKSKLFLYSVGGSIVHGPSSIPLLHGVGASRQLAGITNFYMLKLPNLIYLDVMEKIVKVIIILGKRSFLD